ncbi:MAG: SxtJ family membrane protein [Candidatus Rifleibacteriota bacterium]
MQNQQDEKKELRKFGLIVGLVFAAIALYPLAWHKPLHAWALIPALFLFIPGLVYPISLSLPFRLWKLIGHCLGWINTRIILTVLYFCALVPVSLILKIAGKDWLKLKLDPRACSYLEKPDNKIDNDLKNQY